MNPLLVDLRNVLTPFVKAHENPALAVHARSAKLVHDLPPGDPADPDMIILIPVRLCELVNARRVHKLLHPDVR